MKWVSPRQRSHGLEACCTFVWKGIQTMVTLVTTIYEKGIKLCTKDKKILENRMYRTQSYLGRIL